MIRNEGGVMCILIIIWIQQVQTHEGVLAAVTALPDLIKRWPELICIEEATAAGASSKAFWYVDVFLIQPNYWKILPVLGPTCQPFICFCFHLVLCSTHLSTSRLIGVSTSESTCWTLPFSPTAPLAPSHLFSLGVFFAAPSLSFRAVLYFGWFHHLNFDLNAKGEFSRWWGGCTDNCSCTRASPE